MSRPNNQKVSIIVPVYNAEKYLEKCVLSILNQTYPYLEIIAINDGSTDSTLTILEKFAKSDNRLKILTITNNGVSNARNVGIEASSGEYIMFIDSDDYIDEKAVEKTLKEAIKTQSDIVLFSWNKLKEGTLSKEKAIEAYSDKIKKKGIDWLKARCIGPTGEELTEPTKTDLFNTPWAKLYRSYLIKDNCIKYKNRNSVGMEDVLFNIEVYQQAKKVTYLSDYSYNYRLDSDVSLSKIDVKNLHRKLNNLNDEVLKLNLTTKQYEALENRRALNFINISLAITSSYREKSWRTKLKELKKVLKDGATRNALNKLNTTYMPIYWRVFFFMSKKGQATLVYLIISIARFLRR